MFEGLLPEPFNSLVLTLLFTFAEWHAYAKLRLHTETTVSFFKTCTERLGKFTRKFKRDTEAQYHTKDLARELAARGRRAISLAKKTKTSTVSTSTKTRYLNLNTSKYHALGHYPSAISRFGTLDSVSTQTVSQQSSFVLIDLHW